MKRLFVLFVLAFVITDVSAQQLRVMTYNIRYNNKGDSLNAWPHRKDNLVSQVLYHGVQVLGVQEALHDQMQDLATLLPRFRHAGGGREDGKEKGEYSAVFYDTTAVKMIRNETFWLSETPKVPGSKSWDAALNRVVTWCEFIDRKTKKRFYFFNTHFDHVGQVARRESASLLLRKVDSIAGKTPVIVTGDFNARPADEPIKVLVDKANPLHLLDTRELSKTPAYGPTGTFNGFGPKERDNLPIDYIFVKGKWNVLSHATFSQTWNGRFASDHFPILVELSFK